MTIIQLQRADRKAQPMPFILLKTNPNLSDSVLVLKILNQIPPWLLHQATKAVSKNSFLKGFKHPPSPYSYSSRNLQITVNSSPPRDPANQLQPQFEGSSSKSSGNVQTQFRFQEPVVPESSHSASPTRPGESSIVHVKWDSERKRRQGYFAQEEGAEKSPFRHYNKANCDFES